MTTDTPTTLAADDIAAARHYLACLREEDTEDGTDYDPVLDTLEEALGLLERIRAMETHQDRIEQKLTALEQVWSLLESWDKQLAPTGSTMAMMADELRAVIKGDGGSR